MENISIAAGNVNKKCCQNTDCSKQNLQATFIADMGQKTTEKSIINWVKFGQWMRNRREAIGLSQDAAAEAVKIHPQTWYRLESGASTKNSTMLKIAQFLATSDNDLDRMLTAIGFARPGAKAPPNTQILAEMMSVFSILSPDRQSLALAIIKLLRSENTPSSDQFPDNDYPDEFVMEDREERETTNPQRKGGHR